MVNRFYQYLITLLNIKKHLIQIATENGYAWTQGKNTTMYATHYDDVYHHVSHRL